MRGYEEDELADCLKELINNERELEACKQALAKRSDFNFHDCFALFDYSNTGLVTVADLQDAFNQYGVFPSRDEAQLIMNRYDNNGDNRLAFQEFCELFDPRDQYYADLVEARPSRGLERYYPRSEYFVGYTRDDFCALLR